MSEEITIRLSFPKHGYDDVTHSFDTDKEAACILEYAISKYPEIQATSQIYMLNDSHKYTYVAPEENISALDLHSQHQILIMPETYQVDFVEMDGDKEKAHHLLDVSNESYVAEKLALICVKNNLLDPIYYNVLSGTKELVQDESITEQVPYAKSLSFRTIPLESLYDLLIRDFLDSTLNCTLKDKQMIVMFILYVNYGPYKAAQRPQYDQKIKDSIPKKNRGDSSFSKSLLKSVIDMYKQSKQKSNPMKECVEMIMSLQHFSSVVAQGIRSTVSKKRQVKPAKVTFSLNYSTLRVFKPDSATLLEEYQISSLVDPKMDDPQQLQFEYEIQGQNGRTTVQCRLEEKSEIFKTVMSRCQSLVESHGKGSSGSSGSRGGAIYKSIQIPAFVLGYNLFSDVPRRELNYTVIRASLILTKSLKPIIEEYGENGEKTGREPAKLFSTIKASCNLISSYKSKLAIKLMKSFEDTRTLFSVLKITMATSSQNTALNPGAAAGLSKKKSQEMANAVAEFENQKNDFKAANAFFMKTQQEVVAEIEKHLQQPPLFNVRPEFVDFLRCSTFLLLIASWVNESQPCRELIDQMKKKIVNLIKYSSNITAYSQDPKKLLHAATHIAKKSAEISGLIEKSTSNDKQFCSDLQEIGHKEIKSAERALKKYFKENKPVQLTDPMSLTDIVPKDPRDPRSLFNNAKGFIDSLSSKRIDNLADAELDLATLRGSLIELLEMSPKQTHEPLVLAYNDFKVDVERNFASYGANSVAPAALRCQKTLDNVFSALNPAKELRNQLKSFPKKDPRVIALLPIIDYLSENGPLFNNSPTHLDIQRFIAQMPMGKTATLLELAFTIESNVPENLRSLTDTCDPTKDLYKEVDEEMSVSDAVKAVTAAAEKCGQSAIDVRKALRINERNVAAKYRQLNLTMWRTMSVFTQFAQEESAGSVGHRTFTKCRDAFKTLLEESAYDIKRDRQFLPFIDELTRKVNSMLESPRDSTRLASLGGFLLLHQTRPGFYTASKALAEFNHYVLVYDSNKAAERLLNDATQATVFRKAALMISVLKRRYLTLLAKVDLAMKTKIQRDVKHSDVDLRSDYQNFLIKYTDNLFVIFSQLIVAMTTKVDVLQQLSTGCDAIERLFPSIMNVETPAPYLARSVCGIVFSSMEFLITQCKEMGGKAQQSSNLAFLSVREFLFNIRRKIADAEKAKSSLKTGIGIADMYAVIERDNKLMNQQIDFQRSIRKKKW